MTLRVADVTERHFATEKEERVIVGRPADKRCRDRKITNSRGDAIETRPGSDFVTFVRRIEPADQ
jgi:hypothetical protein